MSFLTTYLSNAPGLDAFEDERVVAWVKEGGHKRLVITGLWTESCVTNTTLSALHAGFGVHIITDAAGGGSMETHDTAVPRMAQAGVDPTDDGAVSQGDAA